MGFGDLSSGAAVALVIGVDGRKSLCCFARRGEAEQPLAVRQERTWPGVLHHRRLAAGEVADRPVADPGVLEFQARPLRATELAPRLLEVGLIRLRRVGDFARRPDAPTSFLQVALLLGIFFRPQIQSQFQRLGGQPRQVRKFQEGHSLGILINFVSIHDPVIGVPVRHRSKWLGMLIKAIRPLIKTNGRPDMQPLQPTIGKARRVSPYSLPSREVQIMPWNRKLAAADPELQQPRINVHQRRASEARKQRRRDSVVKIQEQVRAFEDRFSLPATAANVFLRQTRSATWLAAIKDEFPAKAKPRQAREKRRQQLVFLCSTVATAERFQPVNLAAQRTQALRVLHVNPEVPAAFREIQNVEWRDDDGGHVRKAPNSRETPNPKLQAPGKHQRPSTHGPRAASFWSLVLGASLEFGVWSLELRAWNLGFGPSSLVSGGDQFGEIVITDEFDGLLAQDAADERLAQRAQLGFALCAISR